MPDSAPPCVRHLAEHRAPTLRGHAGASVSWWEFVLWGAFGGLAVELLEFQGAIRRGGTWPWNLEDEPDLGPYLASIVIRIIVSAGIAWALGASGQVSGPWGAMAAGVAAPLTLEQLDRQLPASRSGVDRSARSGSQGDGEVDE